MIGIVGGIVGLVIVIGLLYWLIFVTEGVYLGERVVVWLYDLYAGRYDKIKEWQIWDEISYLAEPFAVEVGRRRPPLILDVAAGTGRLAWAVTEAGLLPDARWVLLDASRPMLDQPGSAWIWATEGTSSGIRRPHCLFLMPCSTS